MSGSYMRDRAPMSQALASGLRPISGSQCHPGYHDGFYGLAPLRRDDRSYMFAFARGHLARLLCREEVPQPWERKQ